ncbi:hypothetical protein [Cytobacillus purgationiresistens]|uniref:Thiamine kinase-like enzyme n=1 Tax=Cytobacillus purgationiresistens TaxID=863449 RepID=A0ABU0AQ25_9BACI|nr:hypothetical protein [Cytobacillus purgationiresistens]MDQ0273388.1 thiamine kinase-like enzyme [Cytobacillus purgationiresistens]
MNNQTIFDLLPTFDYVKYILNKYVNNQSIWRINYSPRQRSHSPESFAFNAENKIMRVWLKFTLPTQIKEGQVLKDLTSSELGTPQVLYEEYTEKYDFIILTNIQGYELANTKNKQKLLPEVTEKLAVLQAFWAKGKKEYGESSFSYLNTHDKLVEGLDKKNTSVLLRTIDVLNNTKICLTHGDSTPYNWIITSNKIIPLDFKETTMGHCLLDLVQLLNPHFWENSDPEGHYRRKAINVYTNTLKSYGFSTPWENNENKYLYSAWILDRVRTLNFFKQKINLWQGNDCIYLHPMFVNKKTNFNQIKNNAILTAYWPKLF